MIDARQNRILTTAGLPVAVACAGNFFGYWFSRSRA